MLVHNTFKPYFIKWISDGEY